MGSIEQAQSQSGVTEGIPPETLVSPLAPEYTNLSGESLSYVDYYAPSVLALILQHIAVTLGALAIVREKERGILEMFRVAPVSAWNIVIGKYLGYLIFLMLLSIGLVSLLVYLGTPFLGDFTLYAAFMALYILAALGIGFLISCVSSSDTTAIQLSMLVLLVSMLFSGFFLAVDSFASGARILSEAIPLTQAIQGLQNIMLKGTHQIP
jgi:ABC-2 type transport system permease protein